MPLLHPCVCGHEGPTVAKMANHRRKCPKWKDRPDPRGLMIWRLKQYKKAAKERKQPVEERRAESAVRLQMVTRAGIPLKLFSAFLRALARRYPYGVGAQGGPATMKSP